MQLTRLIRCKVCNPLRYRGHMTEVAKRLGISHSTLSRKMREFGLEEPVS